MAKLRFEIQSEPSGLAFQSFLQASDDFLGLLREIDQVMTGRYLGSLRWYIDDLRRSADGMTLAPRPAAGQRPPTDRKRCGDGAERQDRLPQMLDQHAADACAQGAGARPVSSSQRVLEPIVQADARFDAQAAGFSQTLPDSADTESGIFRRNQAIWMQADGPGSDS